MNIFKKHYLLITKIFLSLIIFSLLLSLTFVDLKDIYKFDFSEVSSLIYFLYFSISIISLITLRFFESQKNNLREESTYTFKFIFLFCLFLIPSFIVNYNFLLEHAWETNLFLRVYWKIALLYLGLALLITPIIGFIKDNNFRNNLLLLRKVLWIISFLFFFKHWLEYFTSEYLFHSRYDSSVPYLKYIYDNMLIRNDALSWFISWVLMLTLWITSNKVSVKLFSWKWWKTIQSLVYPLFLLAMIHVAFTSRFDDFYIVIIFVVVFFRTSSYIFSKDKSKLGKTTKYICVPCWYIYDEAIWDMDGWLKPWTKYEDIPDGWRCPVCWVSKADFEPYYSDSDDSNKWYQWEIDSLNMLTKDVLEVWVKIKDSLKIEKGQYASIELNDNDWSFSRSYSVVEYDNNILKFWIKLGANWRWSKVLKALKQWSRIQIKWIYWSFILKNNKKPKVFLATGTWLSPIMNMLTSRLEWSSNKLFFSVSREEDLFYLDKLNSINNLETNIYLTKENNQKYNSWRIDLKGFDFSEDTEFYICWNPDFVNSTCEYLYNSWLKNIYSEKFN